MIKKSKNNSLKITEYGKEGEKIAEKFYIKNGFTLLSKNFFIATNSLRGEIDLIVKKDNIIVFIEVKRRSYRYNNPILLLDKKKKERMINLALLFLTKNNFATDDFTIRFDMAYLINNDLQIISNFFTDNER